MTTPDTLRGAADLSGRRRQAPGDRNSRSRLVLLGGLVALGPLSTDAYVSGLPAISSDLRASTSLVQLTITTSLLGLALGQLVVGPLSDALGRRRPLLAGLAVYATASVAAMLAPSVGLLIAARAVQGLGGAAALVIAYAIVRDTYEGTAAARAFSVLLLVTGIAPVAAPVMGAQLLHAAGWRSIFLALSVVSLALLIWAALAVTDPSPAQPRQAGGLHDTTALYRRLLKDRALVGFSAVNALIFGAMFAYIAGSPFVLEQLYGLSPRTYSAVFGINALGLVVAAQVSGHLVRRVSPHRMVAVGVAAAVAAGMALPVVTGLGLGLWPLLAALFVVVSSVGLVAPNAAALALDDQAANAGAAAAVLGSSQFLLGGLAAPIIGLFSDHSATPLGAIMAILTVAAAVALARGATTRRSDDNITAFTPQLGRGRERRKLPAATAGSTANYTSIPTKNHAQKGA